VIHLYVMFVGISICAMGFLLLISRLILGRRKQSVQRGMFRFSDGVTIRSVDPIAVLIGLEAHKEFRFDLHPKRAEEGETDAYRVIASAVREAFGVPEYTEPGKPGLTVIECYQLFRAFVLYADSQKKSINLSLMSQLSTESISRESEVRTTNNSSVSGSIASEPSPSTL
jgi:hypothetical protein